MMNLKDVAPATSNFKCLPTNRFASSDMCTANETEKQTRNEVVIAAVSEVEDTEKKCEISIGLSSDISKTKTYKRRYWMLFLFVMSTLMRGMLYMIHVSIARVTSCYYGVSVEAVNWTGMSFLLVYLIFLVPGDWLMGRIGLRNTVLFGSLCNALCSTIMFEALDTNRFPVLMVSVAVGSFSMVFLLAVPPLLAAVWFPEKQVSRACAMGALGNQIGCALGFIFPPLVVSNDCSNKLLIKKGKEIVTYTLTAITALVFVLIFFTFQNNPEVPPSIAELRKKKKEKISYKESMTKIVKNYHFVLLLITNGCVTGIYYTIATILNTLMLTYFPNKDVAIGWMGALLISASLLSSCLVGYMLDIYHKFKETSIAICAASCLSYVLFTGLMETKILWIQFITISILGFFLTGFYAVAYEYGVEIIYPESEALSAGFLNSSAMVSSLVLIPLSTITIEKSSTTAANILLSVVLLLGCISSCVIKSELKRTNHNVQ